MVYAEEVEVKEEDYRRNVAVALWMIAFAQVLQLGLAMGDVTLPWVEYLIK